MAENHNMYWCWMMMKILERITCNPFTNEDLPRSNRCFNLNIDLPKVLPDLIILDVLCCQSKNEDIAGVLKSVNAAYSVIMMSALTDAREDC